MVTRFARRVADYLEQETETQLTRRNTSILGVKIQRTDSKIFQILIHTVSESSFKVHSIGYHMQIASGQASKLEDTVPAIVLEHGENLGLMPLIFTPEDARKLGEDVYKTPPLADQPRPGMPVIATLAIYSSASGHVYRYDYQHYTAESRQTEHLAVTSLNHLPVMVETGRKIAEKDADAIKALTEELTESQLDIISGVTRVLDMRTRVCEYCGRPNAGRDRCPHAIDSRFPCPRHMPDYRKIFRHIGV